MTLNNLIILYSKLSEYDQYQAIWKRRAYFAETSKAIEYYNEGSDLFCALQCNFLLPHIVQELDF